MISLDMKTILFSSIFTNFVCLLVMILLWHQTRTRYKGLSLLVLDFLLQTFALVLITARGTIPDWISIIVSNSMIATGALLGYMGLGRFVNKHCTQIHNYLILVIFVIAHTWFTIITPSLMVRSLNIAITVFLITLQCMWLLLYRVEADMRRLTRFIGLVFGAYCLISLFRMYLVLSQSHYLTDYFKSSNLEPIALIGNQLVFLLLTISLVLVVNKRLILEVRSQEEKYTKAFQSAPYAIILSRLTNGLIMEINEGFTAVTGYGYEDVAGKTTYELNVWANIEDRMDVIKELTQHGSVRSKEIRFRVKTGESIIALYYANTVMIGHEVCVLSSISDITERKQAEDALADSQRLFHSAFDNAATGMALVSVDWSFIQVNRALCETLGYTEAELLQHTTQHVTHPDDLELDIKSQESLLAGELNSYQIQKRLLHKAGHVMYVRYSVSLVRDADGNPHYYILQVEDITESVNAELVKTQLQQQLAQALKMESIGRLAGGVAHDFNNMLGIILGFTELANEKVDPTEPLADDLEQIKVAAQHSAELTRQLLAFARKQTAIRKIVDVNETVTSTLSLLRRLVGADITVVWQPSPGVWPIHIDPVQIQQILTNLCANARDAITEHGQITIQSANVSADDVWCTEYTDMKPGDYVMLTVTDNGCGIDPSVINEIFEPFFTTKGIGQGTGLGLATVYGAIKQNNGHITVRSVPGSGTSFNILIPRYVQTAAPREGKAEADQTKPNSETLLLVEDEPAILKMGKRMLEQRGYKVLTAETPREALRLAADHAGTIDLLLTDVVMPEMNGRELAQQLGKQYPYMKRVFMSGYTADVIEQRNLLDENVHFIQKPFTIEAMIQMVRVALDDGSC